MTVVPLDLYDAAISSHSGPLACRCEGWQLRYPDGTATPMALGRWCDAPDWVDEDLLTRCQAPTLDVGCGPGRLVAALSAAGHAALGVDIAGSAVRLTRDAGAPVVQASVFDPLPDEGRWHTVLLADGNIGIGGDPTALLRRCRELLAPQGIVLVEVDPPGARSLTSLVRIEVTHHRSNWFPWSHVSADELERPAAAAGLRIASTWKAGERWFASLAR